jgi:hypothetical protein
MSDYTFPLSFFAGDLHTPYTLAAPAGATVEPSILTLALVQCYVIAAAQFCVSSLPFIIILYALMCEAFFRDSMTSASTHTHRQECKSIGLCNSVSTGMFNRFRTFKTALKEEYRLRVFRNRAAEENIWTASNVIHTATEHTYCEEYYHLLGNG